MINKFVFLSAFVVFSLGLVCAGLAGNSPLSLTLVKSIVIKQSLVNNDNKNNIDTVRSITRRDPNLFRRPPGSRNRGPKWSRYDLVYIRPGGLEPSPGTYLLPLDAQLGGEYKYGTFSFSGPGDNFVYINGFGWGTENNNGDFTPYLVQSDYQEIKEPSYEFFWQPKEVSQTVGGKTTQLNPNITLNYVFKVPKNTRVKWGTELSFSRFSFGGGSTANTPDVKPDSIFRWRNAGFEEFSASLSNSYALNDWQLPVGIKLTSFAIPEGRKKIFTATVDGQITAYDIWGKKLWSASGQAPVILYKKNLFVVSGNFQSILYLDSETGKTLASFKLPRFLPRQYNSFALAKCGGKYILFMQAPQQSRILCYRID